MIDVLKALAEEHRVLRRLIARIESSFKLEENRARMKFREGLLVLLPALEQHEKIEDHVFGRSDRPFETHAKWLLESIELEHRQIGLLRNEMQRLLKGMELASLDNFNALALLLTHKLKQHFETEEKRLWPYYNRLMGRTSNIAESGRTEREVKNLEEMVRRNSRMVSDFLERGSPEPILSRK